MQEKYGFVYIWYDVKRKMFYIGRHWGTEDDGYICSSNKMRDHYYLRPNDFKRKIIARVDTKEKLIEEEQRWLNMIKPVECKYKYYNVSLSAVSATMSGRKHSEETKQKMSIAAKGKIIKEETKEKIRIANLGKRHSEETKIKMSKNRNRDYADPIFLKKMSIAAKSRSPETRKKISENNKRLIAEGKIGMKNKKHSEETKRKMSESAKKRLNKLI